MKHEKSHEEMYTDVEKKLSAEPANAKGAYLDFKNMVVTYAATAMERGYCYDQINLCRLLDLIKRFPPEYQPGLLKHVRRVFALRCMEYDKELLDKTMAKAELVREVRRGRLGFRLIFRVLSYNFLTVLCLLLCSIVLMSIVFLPAQWPWAAIFDCEMEQLSVNPWLNATCNVLCYLFSESDLVSVRPLNVAGVFVLLLFKVFNVVVIVNFCCKKLLEAIGADYAD